VTPTIAPRTRALLALLLGAAALLFAAAGRADAHAVLTGSDPQQGVVVDKAPDQVSLTFSEKVSFGDDALRVLGPKGERADTGAPVNLAGTTYSVRLHSGLPDGTYTVAYQVVSEDSHPVAGAFTFSVGAPSQTTVSVDEATAGGGIVGTLYSIGRWLSYAGYAVLVGGAVFVLACWPRGAGTRALQRLVVGGWLALTFATLLLLLLRGSYTTSGKLGDIADLTLLSQVLQTKTGAALISRLLLLAAAALFVAVLFGSWDKREGAERRDLTLGLAVGGTVVASGLAASWAMSEHASTGVQTAIAMPVDVLHLLAVATWLGGLTALIVSLYRAEVPIEREAVRRFSRVAFVSVLVLVATGMYQSWRQLGPKEALTDTQYGRLLLVKLGLVVVLVGVAWLSRRWTARLADGTTTAPAAAKSRKDRAEAKAEAKDRAEARAKERSETRAESKAEAKERAKEPVGAAVGGGDAKRAAQLARQQAAMETARKRKERDGDPARHGLRRSVLAEAGVAVVLLAVTTSLTQTEPGRAELQARAATSAAAATAPADDSATGALTLDMPFDTGGEDGKGLVRVDLDPARTGGNTLHVYVERPNGRGFDVPEIKVAFTLEAQKIGPLTVEPDHIGTGHWSASDVQLPVAGDWKVAVTVRTSEIDQTTVSKNAQIG
jgi:copper transport protein